MSKNSLCHVEISVTDAIKASEFYKDLFGWKIDNSMGDGYVFFQPESGTGGAFSKVDDHKPGNSVVTYVEVDDIDAYLKKAEVAGGKQVVPKTPIPGHGWFGHASDLDGNIIGLYTPEAK